MTTDHTNSAYLGVYLDELEEQLQILDEECLRLEQEGAMAETIQRMFRAAHTLKGSSAAMGFHSIQDITHKVETVFDGIRSGRLAVESKLIDTVFAALDVLRLLKGAILTGNMHEVDASAVVQRLEHFARAIENGGSEGSSVASVASGDADAGEAYSAMDGVEENPWIRLDDYQQEAVRAAIENGYKVQAVYARLQPDAAMKPIRALLIYNNLRELGEIIVTFPDAEALEKDENYQGYLMFILITTESEQAIIHCMNQIAQIDTFHIQAVTPCNLDAFEKGTRIEVVQSEWKQESLHELSERTVSDAETKVKVNPTVRVDVERLERLMNYVGELIIDNTRLHEVKNRLHTHYRDDSDVALLSDISNHLSRVISELQDGMMKTRMLPIEQLFSRFPRVVRDIAQKSEKEIEFIMEGKETELDRTLIEELGDPILHILRNAADHGLEKADERMKSGKPAKGRIVLKAAHQENQIVITITDDGRGIDPQRIKQSAINKGFITEAEAAKMTDRELIFLIFHAGFSTASSVTDLSGRGVGMDIVRSHIEKLNGIIDIHTKLGEGTEFTIKLPLTLAIIRSLLIKLANQTFAVPLVNVIEILRLSSEEIRHLQGQEVCVIRGSVFPLVRVHKRLGITSSAVSKHKRLFVVMLGIADKRVCLVVDGLVGNQEIVIKTLGSYVGNVPYIAGSTILGNGNVALILDVGSLVREEGSMPVAGHQDLLKEVGDRREERQLVTFTLDQVRYALDIRSVREIITVPYISKLVSTPEHVLGIIKLRGNTLPVLDLRSHFQLTKQEHTRKTRIIVVELYGKEFGLLVDQVTEVSKIRHDELVPVPKELVELGRDLIDQVYERDGRFVMLLLLERLVPLQQLEGLAAHAFA
ncbi:chemotaxis protein CheW [Paenibacillus hexagrammi]|uniref:Chemotaxis protein CheA n=1 Tax=Paenibacillus hexagrammi TaxID=2908839 RepID=A0ABY3SGM8_9BACL|nr:chemotaxis protein CheW [Paenibacillus sp. YPD9-1]UJF32884.1 chemotaxis protein CheW [Paenibacillus sp. YPD9-1]